jgi:hypothetical protein
MGAILMLTLSVSSFPRDNEVRLVSPLLLDGKVLDPEKLTTGSAGKLSFVSRDATAEAGRKVSFFVYLRRAGSIVNADSYHHAVEEIEISEILKSARAGDELVIDPATKRHGETRHSVNLKQSYVTPWFRWFFAGVKSTDGC